MTRLLSAGNQGNSGQRITVSGRPPVGHEMDDDPFRFTWQERIHQVLEITSRWRVDIDWWQGRIWRAYFKVSTDSGLLAIIYQDLITGNWYLQRYYD
jgi:hypothetical protein